MPSPTSGVVPSLQTSKWTSWCIALALVTGLAGCNHGEDGLPDASAGVNPGMLADLSFTSPSSSRDGSEPGDLAETSGTPSSIDPNGHGGTVGLLSFTTFGDVRPAIPDDDSAYPTTTITSIFKGMAAQHPQFAVATGDYMYVLLLASSANAQLAKLKAAGATFVPPVFYGLGNHECNSESDINCPNLNESVNITAFLTQLVPFTPVPWYDFTVHTSLGDAKFLFIAANAWNAAQQAWLTQALATPTPYTFVIRHQPTPDAGDPSTAPGIAGSNALLAGYPVTLFIYGHVHEYLHLATNAVITGNAGAPLSNGGDYGWLNIEQRADGTVAVTAYSVSTGMPIDTWAVTPAGLAAP